jgi:hypothetical protein
MKPHTIVRKKIIFVFLATFVALAYVNQQVLIYQMGLRVKENYNIYSKLVDRNRLLVYNVLNLKSPVNLHEKLLASNVEMDMPQKWQVVKLENSPANLIEKETTKKGLFASLFDLNREAEASPNTIGLSSLNY